MNNAPSHMHKMHPIPDGKSVVDLLPVFANVVSEIRLGKSNPECACCRKSFGPARKRRKKMRVFPVRALLPVVFSFDICGRCYSLFQKGGASRDGVLALVEAYCEGSVANQ